VLLVSLTALPGFAQFRGAVRGGGIAMGAHPSAGLVPRGGLVVTGGGVGQSRGVGFTRSFVYPGFPYRYPGFGFACAHNPSFCGYRFGPRFGYWWGAYAPAYWGGAYLPGYWDYNGNDNASAQLQAELANQQNLNAELQQELMRQQAERSDAEAAAQQRASARPSVPAAHERPAPATVLVFRDGRRQEVQNYAIVGNTLFDLEPNRTEKILLSQLDIPASIRANDERGVEFSLPRRTP